MNGDATGGRGAAPAKPGVIPAPAVGMPGVPGVIPAPAGGMPGGLPGLPGGSAPFNLPPGFDKFSKK